MMSIKSRCFRTFRLLNRCWLKILICLLVFIICAILFLHWKYKKELTILDFIVSGNMMNIYRMIPSSIKESKMNDKWRIPDVNEAGIFSAYLDLRPEVLLEEVPNASSRKIWALIKIIAIFAVNYKNSDLTCYYEFPRDQLFVDDGKGAILESPAVAVNVIGKTENSGMRYSAAFVLCKLLMTVDGRLPRKITFSSKSGKTSKDLEAIDFVDIHYTTRSTNLDQDRFMAVCVPSLHDGYDKYANLIEFVEFYRMMGVEHFTFYNTSVSWEVSRVLTYYKDLGVATVIQWQLPSHFIFERTLRYNGIFAAINDCLNRNTMIGGFKYIVNVELDEFIVPRKYENFQQMMNFLDPNSNSDKNAAFIFRNVFYPMYDDDPDPENVTGEPKLLLHPLTTRNKKINPAYDRSKYIARGQDIIELGNHQVWRTRKNSLVFQTSFQETIVDPDIAALHHYRYCKVNEIVCWLRETSGDAIAHKFTDKLGTKVANVYKKLFVEKKKSEPIN